MNSNPSEPQPHFFLPLDMHDVIEREHKLHPLLFASHEKVFFL